MSATNSGDSLAVPGGELLLDVTRLCTRLLRGLPPTGVDRVCLAYVRHYGASASALVRFGGGSFVLNSEASLRLFKMLQAAPSRSRIQNAAGFLTRGLTRYSWRPSKAAILLNVGHSGLERESFSPFIRKRELSAVVFLHDLIPLTHPEFSRPGERERHLSRMRNTFDAAAVITNSKATLDSFSTFAAASGSRLPRCIIAPLASCLGAGRVEPPTIRKPYFVMLGTIEPRKNHWLLLQVWRRLAERLGERAPRLVLIGRQGWECESAMDMLDRCQALRGLVLHLPACRDDEVAAHLRHAEALLFPSFAEGFGLPVLEALASGTPVIASALPVFREFAGDIPEYLDPLDGVAWLDTIADFATGKSMRREAQLLRLAAFRPPTWNNHFARVDALLCEVTEFSSSPCRASPFHTAFLPR